MDIRCADVGAWKAALSSYQSRIRSLNKPELISLEEFYRTQLPLALHARDPTPYITKPELSKLLKWKLSRGKWRPRLLGFVDSLGEEEVEVASRKGLGLLPDLEKAIAALTALKGVGPATASAVLAAYAPDVAPFMSDEAMLAVLGNKKDYTLKQYLKLAEKLQDKARELSLDGVSFTVSDVEIALWSSYVGIKSSTSKVDELKTNPVQRKKRKR